MKSKIILYIATSIDGFIAAKDGNIDFLKPYEEGNEDFGYEEFYKDINSLIMGNTTYKQVVHTKEFKEYYEGKTIYVFSKTKQENHDNIIYVNKNVKEFAKKLKGNIWMVGGAKIFQAFFREDLIDEFIITAIPVKLGEGIALFENKADWKKLKLVKEVEFEGGVVGRVFGKG